MEINEVEQTPLDRSEQHAGTQPSLEAQLAALPLDVIEARLREHFGQLVRLPEQDEFTPGHKWRRKKELLDQLVAAYAARPRALVRCAGWPIPDSLTAPLLTALQKMDWTQHARPSVEAAGYVILRRPWVLQPRHPNAARRWADDDPRTVRRRVWELAEELLSQSPGSGFSFTRIALSRNFRASPHRDKNDLSVQYLLAVGDFAGGGELCIEEAADRVRVVDTRNRLACVDGRFPHWVSNYVGERYSIVYYRSHGEHDPKLTAYHELR